MILGMEAKLFWISMACGLYALLLRWFIKAPVRVEKPKAVAVVHGLFWALAGVVFGSLVTSYFERPDLSLKLMVGLGFVGFAWGVMGRLLRDKSPELSWRLIRDDLEWADTGFSAILLAAFIMYFFLQAFKIPSGSMRNTLIEGDHLFVNKFIYGVRVPLTDKKIWRFKAVQRGDVVVFRFPTEDQRNQHYGKDFIKRAIGIPGDTVEIKQKKVYVNGQLASENYTNYVDDFSLPPSGVFQDTATFQRHWEEGLFAQSAGDTVRDNFGPVVIPDGHYLVMGDNRDRSYDSRFWGPMPDKYLKGRAWFVYLPFKRMKVIH
jgi:signal peptidase I